jgi:hypothetical protein
LFQATHWLSFDDLYCNRRLSSRLVGRLYTFTVHNNSWSRPVAHLFSSNVQHCFWWGLGQLHLSTRRADKNSLSWWGPRCRCKPDCRCGTSSISIEPDQPVSNVLLERNNSYTNINCSNKFDKHDSLYTQIWTGFYFIKDK